MGCYGSNHFLGQGIPRPFILAVHLEQTISHQLIQPLPHHGYFCPSRQIGLFQNIGLISTKVPQDLPSVTLMWRLVTASCLLGTVTT